MKDLYSFTERVYVTVNVQSLQKHLCICCCNLAADWKLKPQQQETGK